MIFQRKKISFILFIHLVLVWLAPAAIASNINLAEQYFEQKNYKLATAEYIAAAQIGNPRAFYQLGAIHYQGLGIDQNNLQALMWFSLAAEQHYHNSNEIVEQLLSQIPEHQQPRVAKLIQRFQKKFGQQGVHSSYYPKLKNEALAAKVTFTGKKGPDDIDKDINELNNINYMLAQIDGEVPVGIDQGVSDIEALFILSEKDKPLQGELYHEPYALVVDYDIAPDGSLRDFTPLKVLGNADGGFDDLTNFVVSTPTFNDNKVHFAHRSYLGVSSYDIRRMRDEESRLYSHVKRSVGPLKASEQAHDKYLYAMALMNYRWLTRAPGKVEQLLNSAAQSGHALAQLEYGMKLYREQTDIELAIYWVSAASKHGLAQAEYRLGRLLLDSPWVIKDEKKSLFWLETAAKKNHKIAMRKAAEIKLLADDKALHDVIGAIHYLALVKTAQADNPEYHYLQAIAHSSMQPRKLSIAVKYIRKAINLGQSYHWDVSQWQQQHNAWTSGGSVTITEI